jgi:hypothetical protein
MPFEVTNDGWFGYFEGKEDEEAKPELENFFEE